MHRRNLILSLLAGSIAWAQAPAAASPLTSPEVQSNGTATFRLRAPNAKQVTLNLSGSERAAMQRDAQGVWSITTAPLPPDVYPYSFVVDGQSFADPSNRLVKTSLRRGGQSLLHVPGPASLSWEVKDVPHGTVHHQVFRSAIVGADTDYYVYTPPNWNPAGKEQYPALFLLHGMGDDSSAWTTAGLVQVMLDNLIAEGKAKPMIVVTPYGYGLPPQQLAGGPPAMRSENSRMNFTRSVIEELTPQVEKTYRASKDRGQRAVAGLSMGGAEALFMGLNHPETFAWVAGLSSALTEYTVGVFPGPSGVPGPVSTETFTKTFPKLDAGINSRLRLLWVACGTEDNLIQVNRDFKDWLKTKDIRYTSIETPGAHTWMVWRRNFTQLAPLLFQGK
ncbi:MAG TPA: alpha/beta hydrolase-fold protein [Bryobacteraceae bacterium]|nr:alpha/beta hydrolase-fold protein [Bryobacteraceae bacterium]